jgi:UDP-N-acetylglucosamine transferase subunit ALG13
MADRPLVAVLLGTDHHRFDRLVGWVRDLAAYREFDWFVQHGGTPLPAELTGAPLLTAIELDDLLSRAAAVVTHGGPGLVMDSRSHGHHPVVVPRDPALGEHVDGHQQRFAARIGARGTCTVAQTSDGLWRAVHDAAGRRRRDPVLVTSDAGADLSRQVAELVDNLVAPAPVRTSRPVRWAPWRP